MEPTTKSKRRGRDATDPTYRRASLVRGGSWYHYPSCVQDPWLQNTGYLSENLSVGRKSRFARALGYCGWIGHNWRSVSVGKSGAVNVRYRPTMGWGGAWGWGLEGVGRGLGGQLGANGVVKHDRSGLRTVGKSGMEVGAGTRRGADLGRGAAEQAGRIEAKD